jgi:dUTPase
METVHLYDAKTPEFKFALRHDLIDRPEFLPTKANPTDTGWDVRCAEKDGAILYRDSYHMISLGFRVLAPTGYWLKLVPRSSTFIKKHLHALYGTIDETYSGIVSFCCQMQHPSHLLVEPWEEKNNRIEFGDRIGQLIPVRRQEMIVSSISNEEIDKAFKERGERGGFGSSGQK